MEITEELHISTRSEWKSGFNNVPPSAASSNGLLEWLQKELEEKDCMIPSLLQPDAEVHADEPFHVVDGQFLLVADVGEVEHHGESGELVASYLFDHRAAPCDDDLREVVV